MITKNYFIQLIEFGNVFSAIMILTHQSRIINKTRIMTPANIDKKTIHMSNGTVIGFRSLGCAIVSIYLKINEKLIEIKIDLNETKSKRNKFECSFIFFD